MILKDIIESPHCECCCGDGYIEETEGPCIDVVSVCDTCGGTGLVACGNRSADVIQLLAKELQKMKKRKVHPIVQEIIERK